MQEYSSISVSSYEAAALAANLTEQSSDGWTVVSIVPTGSTITAYLSREAGSGTPAATEMPAEAPAEAPSEAPAVVAEAAVVAATVAPEEPAAAPPEPAAEPPAAAPAASPEPAADGAPAGWYADPSARFELRYWDGSQWTEHVSRGGQQFTDPPVA